MSENVLEKIMAKKRLEIAAAKAARPLAELEAALPSAPTVRDFYAALDVPGIQLIAEVKKASPSAGLIRADFHPVQIAATYSAHGAACISVLTDEHFFQGQLDYLTQIRAAVDRPVLRKDFILDPYQVVEARVAGADAVLLIAECLTQDELVQLHDAIVAHGMTPLVEFYEPQNAQRVVDAGAQLIGVNNRDLKTFVTDLQHTVRMRQLLPADRLVVGESGIRTHADVQMLQAAGVGAMLVGESLTRQPDIGAAVDSLLRG